MYYGLISEIMSSWGNGMSVYMAASNDVHHGSYGLLRLFRHHRAAGADRSDNWRYDPQVAGSGLQIER